MRKRRAIVFFVLAILVVGAGFAVYVTLPSWYPRSTTLAISPSESSAASGSSMVFSAIARSGSTQVAGGTVSWSVTGGSLDKTTGSSVIFTAPSVTSNTSETVTASFGGIGVYQASSASAHVTIYPVQSGNGSSDGNTGTVLPYLYTMTFESATMTNVKFMGPIAMNGTSVTVITCDASDLLGFNLSRFGLTASTMNATGLTLYTTSIETYSTSFNGAIEITGNETVNMGPVPSAAFGSGTFSLVRLEAASVEYTGVTLVSENTGGSDPYVPSILSTPSAQVSNGYALYGPVTYQALNNNAMNLTVAQLSVQQFSFEHPTAFSLNRSLETYSATNMWLLDASSATATTVQAYVIYFHIQVMGYSVTASGGDYVNNVIPGGFNVGSGFSSTDTKVLAVYLYAGELSLDNLVISIE